MMMNDGREARQKNGTRQHFAAEQKSRGNQRVECDKWITAVYIAHDFLLIFGAPRADIYVRFP